MDRFSRTLRAVIAGAALSSLLILGASAAGIGTARIDTDALRLRKGPGTNTTILTLAYRGEEVTLLEDVGNGWYRVKYGSLTGYMSADYLDIEIAEPTPAPTETPAETPAPTEAPVQTPGPDPAGTAEPTPDPAGTPDPAETADPAEETRRFVKVSTGGSVLNLRSGPGTDHKKITALVDGAVVEVTGEEDGWYAVTTYSGLKGYLKASYTEEADKPDTWDLDPDDLGVQIVEYAKTLLGKKYVFGATGPNSFDCSGFTYYVYKHFGYTINRGGTGQLSNGVSVEKDELLPGDLVFFNDGKNPKYPMSHVGIYIGSGQFIHASTNGYKVIISDLTTGSYARKYVYARRIV